MRIGHGSGLVPYGGLHPVPDLCTPCRQPCLNHNDPLRMPSPTYPMSLGIPLCTRSQAPLASTGGGGYAGNGGGAGYGGSGGSSWGDEGSNQPEPEKRVLWKGWSDRVAADPQFTYKVAVEQVRSDACWVRVGDVPGWPGWVFPPCGNQHICILSFSSQPHRSWAWDRP